MKTCKKKWLNLLICLLLFVLSLICPGCAPENTPTDPAAEIWRENPDLIHEMVAMVDSSQIREHMNLIVSYLNRWNSSSTIIELRNWIRDYGEQVHMPI